MDERTTELLSGFRASNKFSWKVDQSEVEAVVGQAAATADLEVLLAFISTAPNDDPGTGPGPGTLWVDLCTDVVFPALGAAPNSSTVDAVCDVLRGHDSRYERFDKAAFSVLYAAMKEEAVRTAVCESVCSILDQCNVATWHAAIRLLQDGECVAAVPRIAGSATRRDFSAPNIDNAMAVAIRAIVALDPPDLDDPISTMLRHPDQHTRAAVVKALGRYGIPRVVPPMKRRLGGLFNKPEQVPSVRESIKGAIADVKGRSTSHGAPA